MGNNLWAPIQALQTFGTNEAAADYERREYFWKDTVAWNGGTTLVDTLMFTNEAKPAQYKDGTFPNPSQGVLITHLQMKHTMQFTVPDPANQPRYISYFEENSYLTINKGSVEQSKIWFKDLVNNSWISNDSITAAPPEVNSVSGTVNQWMPLSVPIKLGAGSDVKFKLHFASNLTTAAVSVANSAYYPGLGLTDALGNDLGNGIVLSFKGYRFAVSS